MAGTEPTADLDALIQVMSDHIGLGWRCLARSLGFSQTDRDAIEYANERDLKEQIHQFFYKWKRMCGDNASTDLLIAAAVDAELNELLKTLSKKGFCEYQPNDNPSAVASNSPSAASNLPSEISNSPSRVSNLPTEVSNPVRPSSPLNRLDQDVEPDSTNTTAEQSQSNTSNNLHSPESPIAANLQQRSTGANAQQSPTAAAKPSPNLAGSRVVNKLSEQPETEQEFIRRKRLERLLSNASNNAEPSNQDVQRQVSSNSSIPESSPVQSPPVCPFELGDMVMVERADAAPWYGVVKWIGDLPGSPGKPVVGIEMEDDVHVPGGGDGTFNGERFFQCQDGRGLFLPVDKVKKDSRFDDPDDSAPNQAPVNRSNSGTGLESNTVTSNEPLSGADPLQDLSNAIPGLRPLEDMLRGLNLSSDTSPSKASASNADPSDGQERVLIFTIPADHAGLVIGREGKNIQEVERLTNTNIQMERDYGGMGGNKKGIIRGSEENQKKALQLILNRLKRRVERHTAKVETIQIPESKVGLVIGKGGETINAIRRLSGDVDIKIDDDRPVGLHTFSLFAAPQSRSCVITGSEKDIEKAKQLINMAARGGNIVVAATMAALIADLANLGVDVEEST